MRGSFEERLVQIFLAVTLDLIVGDPKSKNFPHPVRWIGKLISWGEKYIYPINSCYLGGTLLSILVVSLSLSSTFGAMQLAKFFHPLISSFLGVLLIFYSISFKSLKESALKVKHFLESGNLQKARQAVGEIVGRDTHHLTFREVARATIESVAENASDGVIAPLFYALLGGPLLAFFYRVVNTLDSMVGYRTERYACFGWASARLDDLLNLLPSRITAFLLLLSGIFRKRNPLKVGKIVFRDAPKHKSLNAGWPEAAMAALLNVQLGGVNYYQGKPSFHAYLGEPLEPLTSQKIGEALFYFSLSYFIFLFLIFGGWSLW